MKERISVTPKILSLNETNDIYMTMNIAILSEDINFNSAQFTPDFIDGVIDNKEKYVGIPFLVNREKLENAEYDNLSHELDLNTGKLKTDQIGSFVDFWKEEVDDANCLMGSIRIFKRFSETCAAIGELYTSGKLETSCEVMISEYLEVSDDGVRKIHYNDGKNALFGSALVTYGAESRAKPTLLIAEAYQKDIEEQGGNQLTKEYNKGVKIKYHEQVETASLKFYEVEQQIYNLVNPVDPKNGGRDYNYWIHEIYHDKVILEDEDNYADLYSVGYRIENDTVILEAQSQWQKGYYGFIPEGTSLDIVVAENDSKVSLLNEQLDKLKEEIETMSKEKLTELEVSQARVVELEGKLEALETELNETKELVVSEQGLKVELETKVTELNATIEDLGKYKEQVVTAEKEAKLAELNATYSKLLSEETFKSEKVQDAIAKLDTVELNSIVVDEVSKKETKVVEKASKDSKDVVVLASKHEDLITSEKDSNYWASVRS